MYAELEITIANSYVNKARSCKSRDVKFELTFAEYRKLYLTLKCIYTNKELRHDDNWSIDRIDNNEGYTRDNCVICDKELNGRKKDLTIHELEQILKVWNRRKKKLSKK